MGQLRVLLAGETWITVATHYKGWDCFTSTTFHDGAEAFKEALRRNGCEVEHLPGHLVPLHFPSSLRTLSTYNIVILSDIGANSLLLHNDTWLRGFPTPNRLELLAEYVLEGGNLIMVGGYMSFQGIQARAAYKGTPVEDVLPVEIFAFDDRRECPEGVKPQIGPDFSMLKGAPKDMPRVLGYNRTRIKDSAYLVYKVKDDPLLAIRSAGKGKSVAWTSDIGPHWCPEEFLRWPGYHELWGAILRWLKE